MYARPSETLTWTRDLKAAQEWADHSSYCPKASSFVTQQSGDRIVKNTTISRGCVVLRSERAPQLARLGLHEQ
ncbi:hypothetical protein Dda_8384 [Drechslerella dactyloides]|uniref:Uncharacterized protein n=1 Tax=Drechslerella dactyloides TaxID=74499 RepID=A0AAD6NFT1_DREDA|nr:hypothetical protein Dda_8384 [Drechslerella dactyloides]